jgi:hypothetical protein
MNGPKLIPIIGYVVVTGAYDEEGLAVYGGIVNEDEAAADRDLQEALGMGFDDAEVYMLVPPDSFPKASDH